jgi:hypothetical protein
MSKERELLKRVRDTLHELKETHYDLYWDIQAELDLAPQKREPAQTAREMYQRGYAKAKDDLKREPLREAEIFNLGYNAGFTLDHVKEDVGSVYGFLNEYGYIDNNPYFKFVRAIEKEHGIGVEKYEGEL